MTTGERIKSARKAAGMTQKQLADKMEVSFTLVSQYERDIRKPKIETLERLAKALNAPVSRLMDSDEYHAEWQREKDLLGFDDIWISTEERIEKLNCLFHQFDVPEDEVRLLILQEKGSVIPASLIEDFYSMNDIGREKAVENVQDLAKIPEYQREMPENAQEAPSPSKEKSIPENNKSPSEGQ